MIRSHHFSAILSTTETIAHYTAPALLELLQTAVQEAGLTSVAKAAATFEPQGVSTVLILEESHVALHVWTESCKIAVDIHVCDYHQNNLLKAEKLAELLALRLTGRCDRSQWSYLSAKG
ncbi:S-adenosylmethionine decarboxylase [Kovacikia minuta CCNUW1]|uniref:S-adenosylmethionine decarboxylase family protein n=1 Tax=Kovacikia minuta TaxID=2931930 RepID=UPI001CCFE808|nr:S-adenosylmethionine decarboxylase [Kovacikia minuta]UBF29254.1 S-adenosylmethionine decarboxylase [Kovacikia minuta CCNUW1]